MDPTTGLRIAEALAAHICNKFFDQIGSICNGLELMEGSEAIEGSEEISAEEAFSFTQKSAERAVSRYRFFRHAYASHGNSFDIDLTQCKEVASDYLERFERSPLEWAVDPIPDGLPRGIGKLILNLVALASYNPPPGGCVRVSLSASEGERRLEVEFDGIRLHSGEIDQLASTSEFDIDDLHRHNVRPYVIRLLVQRMGGQLALKGVAPDNLSISATFPESGRPEASAKQA